MQACATAQLGKGLNYREILIVEALVGVVGVVGVIGVVEIVITLYCIIATYRQT